MAKWSSTGTGILRKRNQKENHEDLLVFGYACKLFRDDEKALYIDQGKHLIPWMGDEKLRIDRYDGRGTLSELAPYEASKEGYDAIRWLGLSETERNLELLCDEERYYALHTNEDEENMYKEEETKRKQQKKNEFQYSYDVSQRPESPEKLVESTVEEDDKPFVPPQALDVPADINIPKTVKENARIEKTALFVSQQGPQMEILIKAKQTDNPQFNFMNQHDPLFKYYRHVLSAFKSGRYRMASKCSSEEGKGDAEHEGNDEEYLHPSLLAAAAPLAPAAAPLPQLLYKPSADCAYSQLVNRIQGNQLESSGVGKQASQLTYEQQQQYYQYYYTLQYYEYYKQVAQYQAQNVGENSEEAHNLPQHQEHYANFAQYMQIVQQQQNQNNPYAQIVTNLSQNKEQTDKLDENSTDIEKAPVLYSQNEEQSLFIGPQQPETTSEPLSTTTKPPFPPLPTKNIPKPKPLLPLVHYSSDSDESSSRDDEETTARRTVVPQPPHEIQVIVDKMANYVSKNGTDFENIVKSKGDPRFEFLQENHEYHAYYKSKIKEYSSGGEESKEKSTKPEEATKEKKESSGKVKEKKIIAPVSFSIKKHKEHEAPKEIKSALPVEESDDENEEEQMQSNQLSQTPLVVTQEVVQVASATTVPTVTANETPPWTPQNPERVSPETETEIKTVVAVCKNGVVDVVDDPILEMIDLTDDSEEKRDAKRAEDRIKDKLAAAARGKLASVSRDRALQLERKRKAAAFLKLKSAKSDGDIKSVFRLDDQIHTISDSDNGKEEPHRSRKKSRRNKEHDSGTEEGEIRKHKKSSKKHKSHKRHSRSRHESTRHKKSKKKRRRSNSYGSESSASSS